MTTKLDFCDTWPYKSEKIWILHSKAIVAFATFISCIEMGTYVNISDWFILSTYVCTICKTCVWQLNRGTWILKR